MKRILSVAQAELGAPSPAVVAHLRHELPQALQGPGPRTPMPQRCGMSPALLQDLRRENPHDDARWQALSDPQARVVATGQQPGILAGPLLVLYKAATAVALARRWQREHGIPVVPLFWNAADDVDFDEIATVGWHEPRGGLFYLQLPRAARRAESFIGDLAADGDTAAIAALQPHLATAQRRVVESILPDAMPDHGRWVQALLQRVFPELVVLDGRSPALRRHAAPLFERYLNHLADVRRVIEAGSVALERLGHQAVLSPASRRMGLFLTENGTRRKTEDVEFLLQQVRRSPENLSPNVTLRSLVQDTLLPTVGFVAGPSEIGYLLELRPLRALLEVPEPALLSRLSGTLVPQDVLHQLEADEGDVRLWLRSPEEALQQRGATRAAASLRTAREFWDGCEARLGDLTAAALSTEAVRHAHKGLQVLRQRMARDLRNAATQELLSQSPGLHNVAQLLQPHGRAQERVLAGLWLVARGGAQVGEELVHEAQHHLDALVRGHQEHAVWALQDVAVSGARQPGGA